MNGIKNFDGRKAISSDDPDALTKLHTKLAELEKQQETMKAANAVIRKKTSDEAKVTGLMTLGISQDNARKLLEPDYAGRIGFANYELTNNNANIRRIKDRIAELENAAQREDKEEVTDKYTYREDTGENRVMFIFDDKPVEAVRVLLKGRGFKWSPRRDAWVRQLNANGIYAADCVKHALAAMA